MLTATLMDIKTNSLQSDLDKNDSDTFYINRVSISTLLPDSKIQNSIRAIFIDSYDEFG